MSTFFFLSSLANAISQCGRTEQGRACFNSLAALTVRLKEEITFDKVRVNAYTGLV